MVADRSVVVRLRAHVREFNRDIGTSAAAVGTLESRLQSADKTGGASIDRLSGRVKILADLLAILGPAAVPIGAVAVPAVAGLAAQVGFATTGALGFIVAVQGIGDGLSALNKAHLEPTTENLAAAELAMQRLSPAGQNLTRQLFGLRDEWRQLRDVSQGALFPGLSDAIDDLEERLPDVERLLANVNEAVGEMLSEGAESLASDRWDDFFTFIATDAPPALADMGRALGSVAHAMTELWMAFDPLNDDFSSWLVESTAQLDEWASGLARTEGFQEFVDYIRTNGPQVAKTLGAVSMAVLHIVEAAAPLGGPVLAALEAVADAISAIASSDAGPAIMATVTALALLRRGMAAMDAVQATTWAQGVKGADTFAGKVAAARTPILRTSAAMGGLALASSDTADGFLLSNAATGAMLGSLAGPWGAAVGGAVGLMIDLNKVTGDFKVNTEELTATLDQQTGAVTRNSTEYAKNALEKQGVLQAARDLGLNLSDVTQAALGNAEAMARVRSGLESAKEGFYNADGSVAVGSQTLYDYGKRSNLVKDAVGEMSDKVAEGQAGIRRMADAAADGADSLTRAERAAQDFADAVTRLNNVLSGRAAARDYQAALDDFTASIKENGRTFDITTEKGRANQAALDNIASTAIRVAENLKGADRQRFLTAAIDDLREAGNKFDVPKSQVQTLIKLLQKANDTGVNPSIKANVSPAMAAINALEARLRAIKDEDVFVNVRHREYGRNSLGPVDRGADGTTVPKTGRPYADRHLYLLADGEEVISNRFGQADRHRPLLKAINGGLADGGTAGDKAREEARRRAEEARRRREERERREEERRQRRLDAQRTKDLLASDLRDEMAQADLEVKDAQRRLRSAQKADRSPREIREARLALKQERTERRDLRQQQVEEERERRREQQEREAQERAEEEARRAEHEAKITEALIAGQEKAANQLIDAAETQKSAAESIRDQWGQAMARTGAAATADFRSSLFGPSRHGLWTGPGGGGSSWRAALMGDINGLNQRSSLIGLLAGQGVRGSALEALLGEASNDQITELLNRGEASGFAALFGQREALLASVSAQAGQAAYGQEFAMASAQVAALGNQILLLQQQLAAITAQRPITVYESVSAQATAAEVARLQAMTSAA